MKILVTPTSLQPGRNETALAPLRSFADELVFNPTGHPLTEDELIPLLDGCDGFIAGLDTITDKVIASCPTLKVISRYGAGYDRVDTLAAKEHGVLVTNTPGVNAQAVGELAFGLILAAARKIPYLNAKTKEGQWVRSSGMELKGKTLGILGLGAIGKVVAQCAQGFGMKVLAYDPYINEAYCADHEIENVSFTELMSRSHVVSLHLPLLDSTRHLINKETLALLPDGAIMVNASRGGIIDEDAAYEALENGRLAGLGLDAFEVEPPVDSKLLKLDNVIATPHTGAHTKEATENMANASVKNLIDLLSGKDCPYIVNR